MVSRSLSVIVSGYPFSFVALSNFLTQNPTSRLLFQLIYSQLSVFIWSQILILYSINLNTSSGIFFLGLW